MPRLNFTKRKTNQITSRITSYNYNPESAMNRNSEIQVTLLPSHNGNRQSISGRSRRRSNELSKRAIALSVQSCPTDKSIAHLEAVYRDTHRQVYQEVHREVYCESTKILLKSPIETATMKSTGGLPKRTSNDDYQVNANCR